MAAAVFFLFMFMAFFKVIGAFANVLVSFWKGAVFLSLMLLLFACVC